jgi:hypothetical protein
MRYLIRKECSEDNQNPNPLQPGEGIDRYSTEHDTNALEIVVEELIDRGGGFVHGENGEPIKFVAPLASNT